MKVKNLLINIIKYILNVCEIIGVYTVYTMNCVLTVIKSVFLRIANFFKRYVKPNVERFKKTFKECYVVLSEISSECYTKAKAHAKKYGKISGLKSFIKEFKASAFRNKQTVYKVISFVAPTIAVIAMMIMVSSFSNVTLALEVKYSNDSIGYILDEQVYNQATQIISKKVEGNADQVATKPKYNYKLVKSDLLSDADELSDAIIQNSNDVEQGYGIYVDGEFYAASKSEQLLYKALDSIKQRTIESTTADMAIFGKKTEIIKGFYLTNKISDLNEIIEILNYEVLPVESVSRESSKVEIEFKTITAKDNTKLEGYKKVNVKGKNGTLETIVETRYLNGVKQQSKVLSEKVIEKAVDEQIIIGTRKQPKMSININAKFAWPVERVAKSYVSCYYNGYGGHTGVDIAAPRGTQIYAANSGVVTKVLYTSYGYGNYFYVDIGNGMEVLYAHCSSIDVVAGQIIEMGEPIAKVGSTGNSTGPHLHFSVIANGNYVNPAPYLGIR